MDARYSIIAARPRDIRALAAIELAAAMLLDGHAPASVLNETTDESCGGICPFMSDSGFERFLAIASVPNSQRSSKTKRNARVSVGSMRRWRPRGSRFKLGGPAGI